MGVIINPRGTAGSGKTEFVRRVMAEYGWKSAHGRIEPILRAGRARPIGYRLAHPASGRSLAVLGHYEATCGGCDTIRAVDGGLDEAFRLADEWAATGHDVLLEGLVLSGEHQRTAALAERHALHVLRLDTPPERCVSNLVVRRRARRDIWPLIARTVAVQHEAVEEACAALRRSPARVEELGFDAALDRARGLLGLRLEAALWSSSRRLRLASAWPGLPASGARASSRYPAARAGRGGSSPGDPAAVVGRQDVATQETAP